MNYTNNITHNIDGGSGFGDAATNSVGPIFGIAIFAATFLGILGFALIAYHDSRFVRALASLFRRLGRTWRYFLTGLATITPLAVLSHFLYLAATAPAATRNLAGAILAGAVLSYALIAGIGYLADRWLQRIRTHLAATQPAEADQEADS